LWRYTPAMSTKNAILKLDDKEIVLPIVVGTEHECGIDVRKLRDETGYITFRRRLRQHGRL